jgi:hypothetical protein
LLYLFTKSISLPLSFQASLNKKANYFLLKTFLNLQLLFVMNHNSLIESQSSYIHTAISFLNHISDNSRHALDSSFLPRVVFHGVVFHGVSRAIQYGIARARHTLPLYALRPAGSKSPAGLTATEEFATYRVFNLFCFLKNVNIQGCIEFSTFDCCPQAPLIIVPKHVAQLLKVASPELVYTGHNNAVPWKGSRTSSMDHHPWRGGGWGLTPFHG